MYKSIRELSKLYAELAHSSAQEEKRRLWKDLNSFRFYQPPILARKIPFHEFFDFSIIKSEDPLLRQIEIELATCVFFRQKLKDDYIFDPWVKVRSKFTGDENYRWGVPCKLGEQVMAYGAAAFMPPIREEEDIIKIKPLECEIDEKATRENIEKVEEALGGNLEVISDRQGIFCTMWNRDISTDLAKLRGLEQMMWDVYDRPEWLHRFISLMQDTILKDIDKTEKMNNFCLCNNENYGGPYCDELPIPDSGSNTCKAKELWSFFSAQEFTAIGPDLYNDFMLSYQIPIMERFGLIAYGCCEDITSKIPLLKKVKNLRRISITPSSDVRKCAEQIGKDYVISYRPNPTDMIAHGLNEDLVRKIVKRDFEILKENKCIFDVTLKDVETIANKPENMIRWVDIVRQIGDEVYN